jgi:hypothetical protein
VAKSTQGNWRAGQASLGEDHDGKKRQKIGNDNDASGKKPRRVTVEAADDGSGYTTETEYDNSGDGPYQRSSKGIHLSTNSVKSHLDSVFGKIDQDETLDAAGKRKAKAKASMKTSMSQSAD